jgi:hypothetical protein
LNAKIASESREFYSCSQNRSSVALEKFREPHLPLTPELLHQEKKKELHHRHVSTHCGAVRRGVPARKKARQKIRKVDAPHSAVCYLLCECAILLLNAKKKRCVDALHQRNTQHLRNACRAPRGYVSTKSASSLRLELLPQAFNHKRFNQGRSSITDGCTTFASREAVDLA